MKPVLLASDVTGLPVVSIATGEDVAEIRDVVYDSAQHKLVGFTLNKRGLLAGRLKDVLGIASLQSLGTEAAMIEDESALAASGDGSDLIENATKSVSVAGNRVLTAEGTALGKVAGVVLTTGRDPQAIGYEIQPEQKGQPKVFAPISAQIALSDDNLLLPSEASALVSSDLDAFFAAVIGERSTQPGDPA